MTIGVIQITLALPSRTLKEKRSIVRSLVERLRNRFNASVAEVGALDDPARTVIAAACISNESAHADAQLREILHAVEASRLDAELVEVQTELLAL